VRIERSGTTTRWPILRPACAAVEHGASVRIDGDGMNIVVSGREYRVPTTTPPGGRCLENVHLMPDAVVVVTDDGVDRYTAAGRVPEKLPPGVVASRVRAWNDGVVLLATDACEPRFVDMTGLLTRPLFVRPAGVHSPFVVASLDDEHGFAVPVDVVAATRDGNAGLWKLAPRPGEHHLRQIARLGPREIEVDDPVVLARDRVLVFRPDRVDELHADGADRVRLVLRADVDARGSPLGVGVRERARFDFDPHTDAIVVAERVRAPDCAIDDRITVIDGDGSMRAVVLPPAMRTNIRLEDGVVWFAESAVDYEAFSDDNGTSLP
jgi:hypothetical protein